MGIKIRETFKEYYYRHLNHLTEDKKLRDNPHLLLEMANLTPQQTGIKGVSVYASQEVKNHNEIRIKLSMTGNTYRNSESVAVYFTTNGSAVEASDNKFKLKRKLLRILADWHEQNEELFQQFWDGHIDNDEFRELVQPYDANWRMHDAIEDGPIEGEQVQDDEHDEYD